MVKQKRRSFIAGSFLSGIASWAQASGGTAERQETPREIAGPFYPITPQKDKDFDLTHIAGRDGTARGAVIWITGEVFDSTGDPVEDASVEIWQADDQDHRELPFDRICTRLQSRRYANRYR